MKQTNAFFSIFIIKIYIKCATGSNIKVSTLYLRDKAMKKYKNYNKYNDNSCYTISENDCYYNKAFI